MKKKLIGLLLAVTMTMSLAACNAPTSDSKSDSKQEQSSQDKSSSDSAGETGIVKTLYNPSFQIEKLDQGIKKVTDGEGRELILVPKELSKVPAEYEKSTVIRTPVEKAVFLSSTQVCTFRTMNDESILDSIAGVQGTEEEWADVPGVAKRITSGKILNIGGEGMGEPDYEKIQSLNPDIVFVYTGSSPQTAQIAKFEELGINYAVDNEYMEKSYLARMEWMRFILTFYNADSEVDKAMTKAQENIDAAKEKIAGKEQPKVAVFNVYDGTVYGTSNDSWVGNMLADMGGVNVFGDVKDQTITMEKAFELAQSADIIIYASTPAYTKDMKAIMDAFPQLAECKAYENDRVYQYTDSFWHGIDQSDIMATDLAAVIYPEVFENQTLTYYAKVNK